ncbi:MAG: CPBP family intramembrane glutamic endopeptidase [Roseiflexaceae bacterium]
METLTRSRSPETASQVQQARRGLLVFASLLVPLSLLGYWWWYINKAIELPFVASAPLMWSPALASLITRLILREGFADVSFRSGGRRSLRAILLAFAVPLLVGSLAYGSAYLTGLAQLAPPALPFLPPSTSPLASLALVVALSGTLGTLVSLPNAAGEEIGWRGYLLPRLIAAGAPRPILLTGLIWGAWHLVPLFTAGYAAGPSLLFSALILMIQIVSASYIAAWMRLDTGSIWPCIAQHAAWNAIINGAFTPSTQGETAFYWLGESGVLVTLALVGVTLVIGRAGRSWITRGRLFYTPGLALPPTDMPPHQA